MSRARVDGATLRRAEEVIDTSGLAETLETRLAEQRRSAAGRRRAVTVRTLLVLLTATALAGHPLHLARVHEVAVSLPMATRRRLGITARRRTDTVTVRQLGYLFNRIAAAVDPSPHFAGPDAADDTADERAERAAALQNVLDELLDATLPRADRDTHDGAYAVDATDLPAWARPRANAAASHDPDAGWYVKRAGGRAVTRDGTEPGGRTKPRGANRRRNDHFTFGYELHAFVRTRADGAEEAAPALADRILVRRAGTGSVTGVVDALRRLSRRRHVTEVIADRWYSSKTVEHFHYPLRALGIDLTFDLMPDQLGVRGQTAGAPMLQGAPHCPATPQRWREPDPPHWFDRQGRDELATQQQRRRSYALARHSGPDADGYERWQCPAEAGKVRCPLKPASMQLPMTLPTVHTHPDPADGPLPRVCQQKTVTIPADAGDRTRQKHYWGSAEWQASYARRNVVEGWFGTLKSATHENVGAAGRLRVFGLAKTSLLVGIAAAACNLRMADAWQRRHTGDDTTDGHTDGDGGQPAAGRQRPRRRRALPTLAGADPG